MTSKLRFPPASLGEWRVLDEGDRALWLDCAHARFFDESGAFAPSRTPGRRIVLDGAIVDSLRGFYCAIGEAVNGPGGYFGRTMSGFDDCLFSGFCLEPPFTIVWKHAELSRRALNHQVLLDYLADECGAVPASEWSEEGKAWFEEAHEAARRGDRTMFDEIVDTVQSVTSRGGGRVILLISES